MSGWSFGNAGVGREERRGEERRGEERRSSFYKRSFWDLVSHNPIQSSGDTICICNLHLKVRLYSVIKLFLSMWNSLVFLYYFLICNSRNRTHGKVKFLYTSISSFYRGRRVQDLERPRRRSLRRRSCAGSKRATCAEYALV